MEDYGKEILPKILEVIFKATIYELAINSNYSIEKCEALFDAGEKRFLTKLPCGVSLVIISENAHNRIVERLNYCSGLEDSYNNLKKEHERLLAEFKAIKRIKIT